MKNLKIIGILVIAIMLSVISSKALAQTRVPGVEVGNSFKYTYTLDINTTDAHYSSRLSSTLN